MEKLHIYDPCTEIKLKFKVRNINIPTTKIRKDEDLNWYISIQKETALGVRFHKTELPIGSPTVRDTHFEDLPFVVEDGFRTLY